MEVKNSILRLIRNLISLFKKLSIEEIDLSTFQRTLPIFFRALGEKGRIELVGEVRDRITIFRLFPGRPTTGKATWGILTIYCSSGILDSEVFTLFLLLVRKRWYCYIGEGKWVSLVLLASHPKIKKASEWEAHINLV
jgi:hypothetical protein